MLIIVFSLLIYPIIVFLKYIYFFSMSGEIPIAIVIEIKFIESAVHIDPCPVRPGMAVITIGWIPMMRMIKNPESSAHIGETPGDKD
jgi:hypothetical protein